MADIEAMFERLGFYTCKTYLFGRYGGHVLLLTNQEDTEALRRSIVVSNGIQEPIYVRADGRVAERALQMQALVGGGLIEDEVAERYRMTAREVRQQLAAVEFMDHFSPSRPLRLRSNDNSS